MTATPTPKTMPTFRSKRRRWIAVAAAVLVVAAATTVWIITNRPVYRTVVLKATATAGTWEVNWTVKSFDPERYEDHEMTMDVRTWSQQIRVRSDQFVRLRVGSAPSTDTQVTCEIVVDGTSVQRTQGGTGWAFCSLEPDR